MYSHPEWPDDQLNFEVGGGVGRYLERRARPLDGLTCQWENCRDAFGDSGTLMRHLQEDHIGLGGSFFNCKWGACTRHVYFHSSRFELISHLRSHMGGRASPKGWSPPNVHERDDVSSNSSDEDLEQSRERTRHSGEYMRERSPRRTTSIHILDDDSLLNIFYLYRPVYQGEGDFDAFRLSNSRWWYKLAQICRRWRHLILRSASYLGLCLFCTNGTRVADMLAHSPPFPLIIYYHRFLDPHIIAGDDEGIVFALQQRNRVRQICFRVTIRKLQRLIMAMDEEYSMLESLVMLHPTGDNNTNLTLPQTFRAPHLQRLVLSGFAFPTGSPLRTTVIGRLVTLRLYLTHPSAYFPPNILLQYLSAMPQLEELVIGFIFPVPNRDVEKQLFHTPIRTHVTLPSLRYFTFQGISTYLEALFYGITAPRLEKLGIVFFNQLIYSLPHLLQFMRTTESLKFHDGEVEFSRRAVRLGLYPRDGGGKWAFRMDVDCEDLDWQVSSVAEISDSLSQAFSAVEHLTLGVGRGKLSLDTEERLYEVDRTAWHRLLRSFGNVKTFSVGSPLVAELSRCLLLEDEELPFGLLPELQQLIYSGVADGDAFKPFIDSRRNASRPVTPTHFVPPLPRPSLLDWSVEPPSPSPSPPPPPPPRLLPSLPVLPTPT